MKSEVRYRKDDTRLKKFFKILLIIFSLITICVGAFIFSLTTNIVMPWDKNESKKSVQVWGGLAEFPVNAENFEYEQRGSMFTRQFIIEFDAPKTEIDDWILKSKGLHQKTPVIDGNSKIYEVRGYENSIGGKVEIKNRHVRINMSWS